MYLTFSSISQAEPGKISQAEKKAEGHFTQRNTDIKTRKEKKNQRIAKLSKERKSVVHRREEQEKRLVRCAEAKLKMLNFHKQETSCIFPIKVRGIHGNSSI